MLMQTRSINDRTLLLSLGFLSGCRSGHGVDLDKLALFCGVSKRTAQRWLVVGIPERARLQLESLFAGDFLPPQWRRLGLSVAHDRLYLYDGYSVTVETLARLRFIMQCIDYQKLSAIYPAL